MATISRITLSSSTDGRGIAVAATASPGTAVHTGPTVVADYHEVWMWASNTGTTAETVIVEFGGSTPIGDHYETIIQPNETALIVPGWTLKGNANALAVKAFSTTTNKVNIVGHINLIDGA
jgi:hypothetical protein